jgi:hypothetical protein
MTAELGTLVLRRPPTAWRDRVRGYRIQVDGVSRFTIRRGEERALELAPGPHRVRARIDWSGSPEIDVAIEAGSSTTCLVEPAGSFFSVYWRMFTRTRWLKLSTIPS